MIEESSYKTSCYSLHFQTMDFFSRRAGVPICKPGIKPEALGCSFDGLKSVKIQHFVHVLCNVN